jgi:5-(carboxyamino)imidazole ribonucleotide synthase
MPVIEPGAALGLLGGGQLGRMFAMAAQQIGYRVVVLDPGAHSPAGSVTDQHIRCDYLDRDGLAQLARACRGVTTEFENVPAESLRYLAQHCVVSPSADSVAVAQERSREKRFLAGHGFAVAPFAVIDCAADLDRPEAGALLPGILKVSRFGYDGKGQARVATLDAARAAWRSMGGETCVLERHMLLAGELSVIVARAFDGEVSTFPVAENHHQHGILDVTIAPARVSPETARDARDAAIAIAERLDYRGVLCVEFFVLDDGRLLVNEIAPRPHNSGHYTIDACVTSQFEQQVRVLAGLPLGDTSMHGAAVMVNILGEAWTHAGGSPDWRAVLRHPRARLHLYGKREARPGRKMGHCTVLADDRASALERALAIRAELKPLAQPAQTIPQ